MKSYASRFLWQHILGMVLLVLIVLNPGGKHISAAESSGNADLEKAVISLWMDGATDNVMDALADLSDADGDIGIKALFHLACAHAMQGNRTKAIECLEQLKSRKNSNIQSDLAERLSKILAPNEPVSAFDLDIREKPVSSVLNMIAALTKRKIIVDSGIPDKKISMVMPNVDFDTVIKILSEMTPFETKKLDDILLVTPVSKLPEIAEVNGKTSLDFKNVEIRDIFQLIAKKANLNLVLHKSVYGKTSVRLNDVDPIEALRTIAMSHDLRLEKDGDTYIVAHAKDMEQFTGQADSLALHLTYIDSEQALSALQAANIDSVKVISTKKIEVKGSRNYLDKAKEITAKIDIPQKPVLISVSIWECKASASVDPANFTKLHDDEKRACANLVAQPKVITMPNKPAEISLSNDESPGTSINLSLNPMEAENKMVRLDLTGSVCNSLSNAEGALQAVRKSTFTSSFIIKPGYSFAYQVQSGEHPLIIEVLVSRPEVQSQEKPEQAE